MSDDLIALLFGGMGKLGPGSDEATIDVLRLLPNRRFELIVDAGCGAGRQTLALAATLRTAVHGVDSHQPFLDELRRRAIDAGVEEFVPTRCMDMNDIASTFSGIDLLWSEGAAYNIGFAHALAAWAPAVAADGYAVVSELCWLRTHVDEDARRFFRSAYPDMQSVDAVKEIAAYAGYEVMSTYTLPRAGVVRRLLRRTGSPRHRATFSPEPGRAGVRRGHPDRDRHIPTLRRRLRLRLLRDAARVTPCPI